MIKRIQILGYRCFRFADVPVSPLTVLVGPNGSGKSTFLDALKLLQDVLDVGVESASDFRSEEFADLTWMRQGRGFQIALDAALPDEIATPRRKWIRYGLSVGLDRNRRPSVREETLWLRPAPDATLRNGPPRLFPTEPQPPRSLLETPYGRNWRTVVRKVPDSGNDYFKSETSGWNTLFRIGPRRAALANLPEDPSRFPAAMWFRKLLEDGLQAIALDSDQMKEPSSPRSPALFESDGSNLPLVVRTLREDSPQRYRDWLAHVRTILPEVREIATRRRHSDRHLYLEVRFRNGLKAPSWLVSDGTLRLLALTLLAYVEGAGRMFLIEEPENGLHPKAIEPVFRSLNSVYDGQVFVATHNVLLIGLARPENVMVFSRTPNGASDVVRGDEHPLLRDWKGELDLGMLMASGILD